MKYFLWIDETAVGPVDLGLITELYLNGVITAGTQIKGENGGETDFWKTLAEAYPSLVALPTRAQMAKAALPIAAVSSPNREVTVTGFEMPFFNMVGFMVKWAFASIPAAIVILAVIMFGTLIGTAVTGGLISTFSR